MISSVSIVGGAGFDGDRPRKLKPNDLRSSICKNLKSKMDCHLSGGA